MSRPTVEVEEHQDGIRVRVKVGSAEMWLRATPGGRRMEVSVDEGQGEVDVEWVVRRVHTNVPPYVTGPYVQSPPRDFVARPAALSRADAERQGSGASPLVGATYEPRDPSPQAGSTQAPPRPDPRSAVGDGVVDRPERGPRT